MKITFLSIAILLLCNFIVHAQSTPPAYKKYYLRAGIGYSFPFGSQSDFNGTIISGSHNYSNQNTFSRRKFSFGSGGFAVAGFGTMFSQYVGIELGLNIGVLHRKYTVTSTTTPGSMPVVLTENFETNTRATTSFSLAPAIVLQVPVKAAWLYSRLGILVPLGNRKIYSENTTWGEFFGSPYTSTYEGYYKTRFSIGFQGSLGVKYPVSFGAFWTEIAAVSMNAYARSFEYEKYTMDGQPREVGNIEYSFDLTQNSSSGVTDKRATFSIPFSNIGAAVGMNFDL